MTKLTRILLFCFIFFILTAILSSSFSSDKLICNSISKTDSKNQSKIIYKNTLMELAVTIQTNKNRYIVGENVTLFGIVQTPSEDPIADATVGIEVKDPNNNTVFLDIVFSLANGTYSDSFRLHENSRIGEYCVYVTATKAGYLTAQNQTTFMVEKIGVHDIAITEITYISRNRVINQTFVLIVGLINLGNFTETFDITVNYTRITDPTIGTQTIALTPGQFTKINFTWIPNATGLYEIKAYTSIIPDDENPSNNTKIIYLYASTIHNLMPSKEVE